ncbi:MAG TPA: hypothetical protein VM055_06405 [Novosphingobium sp.]|nr:hypothetical protein [Novosphingobium sp.]
MYSLLFHNKWLAAFWAGSILLGIYLSTPREGEDRGAAAAVNAIDGMRAEAMARAKVREERDRQAKLDAFNAGEDQGDVQLVESYMSEQ